MHGLYIDTSANMCLSPNYEPPHMNLAGFNGRANHFLGQLRLADSLQTNRSLFPLRTLALRFLVVV